MRKETDHIKDLEYISELFEADGIRAPESLSEENILAMLKQSDNAAAEQNTENIQDKKDSSDYVPVRAQKKPEFKRWLTAAACVLIALIGARQVYEVATAPPDTSAVNGELYTFRSRTEIDRLVNSFDQSDGGFFTKGLGRGVTEDYDAVEESAEMAAPNAETGSNAVSSEAKSLGSSGSADHSDTYLQVEEVDEADIVKTDGRYIYYVNESREVVILSASEGKTKRLSVIGSSGVENYVHDIFLKGDTLITVGTIYDEDDSYSGIVVYNIKDRTKPEVISQYRQTGNIVSSRMTGNTVYLVTTDYVWKGGRTLPKVITGSGSPEDLDYSAICCVPQPTQPSYIVLGAMDISSGSSAKTQTRAIFGATDDIYCNDHNLYTASYEWDSKKNSEYTRIVRASLDGIKIKFNATASIRGRIDDQFSMDEKDGYFRIATTSQRDGMDVNNLYVLDKNLRETGSVTGFARNESIRSVRYFGDKAYVITYEAIDPLFIIDLSDPSAPRIEGEVKIDGFSTLLVPVGQGRLLGIGHATGDNGYGGEYASGLKLALFDISDPSEPKVLDSKEFENMNSPAQETHKALTVNTREGWYAVPYEIWHDTSSVDSGVIIEDDAESSEDIELDAEDDENDSSFEAGVLVFGAENKIKVYDQHKLGSEYLYRSVYIGDYIYALDGDGNAESFRFSK